MFELAHVTIPLPLFCVAGGFIMGEAEGEVKEDTLNAERRISNTEPGHVQLGEA